MRPLKEIQADETRHRRTLVLSAMCIGFPVDLFFITRDLLSRSALLLQDVFSLVILITILILALKFPKQEGKVFTLVLGLNVLGFAPTVLGPDSGYVEILMLLTTTVLAFALVPLRQALVWNGVFLITVGLCWWGAITGLIPDWTAKYPSLLFPMLMVSLVFVGTISWLSHRQYHRNLENVIRLSLYYPISGLPRRQLLTEALSEYESGVLALVRCDNQFDLALVHGTPFGDELTRRIASVLRSFCTKPGRQCFQLRENEYAILLSNPPTLGDDRIAVLTQLHDELEDLSFPPGNDIILHMTVGAAEISPENARLALSQADQALHTAERLRLPVILFDRNDLSLITTADRLKQFSVLRRNLENQSLTVVFQPICDARSLEPVSYEALLRVVKDDGTLESVFPYLATAESMGLMSRLTRVVVNRAVEFSLYHRVPVSLNVSIADFYDLPLIESLAEAALTLGPGNLMVEFLERSDFDELPQIGSFIARMRSLGCRLALDDFGAGYSNLATLLNMTLDVVKLDGEIVKKSLHDEKTARLMSTLVQFCKENGLRVIAEHIDSPELVAQYQQLGVDALQGYFLGMPRIWSPANR